MKSYIVRVKYYRELAGFTEKELANFLGVTQNTITNYEKGRTKPTMRTVIKLAHILGVTTDQLLAFQSFKY